MTHGFRVAMLTASVLVLTSCQTGPPRPIEITLNEEACRQCRMAISQREFAAEVVPANDDVQFFDDIGCLVRWIRLHNPGKAGIFVVDRISGTWLDAHIARFVRSREYPTPMGFGIVAFSDPAEAQAAARDSDGQVLSWEQLFAEGLS